MLIRDNWSRLDPVWPRRENDILGKEEKEFCLRLGKLRNFLGLAACSVLVLSGPASAPVDFGISARLLLDLFVLEEGLGEIVGICKVSRVAELLIC